jgi:site-specific recombinase XerD
MKKPVAPARKPRAAVANLKDARAAAATYARSSRARATWRAYESDWHIFNTWCASMQLESLPATSNTVALFLAAQAEERRAPSTLQRRLAAIRLMHLGAKFPSPHDSIEIAEVMRGIRRRWKRPPAQKAAAVDEDVLRLADAAQPQTLQGLRDRALVLLGFAGAFRRSELVALDVAHVHQHKKGLAVLIASSKTDQEGRGQVIAILRVPGSPYCPVQALADWREAAEISTGPIFRRMYRGDRVSPARLTDQSVALVIKALALKAGLDPALYAGHSLRRGFLTSAARQHANIFKMADQSRHRSLDVLREYVKDRERFEDHAAEGLLQRDKRVRRRVRGAD